ncbi:uncharacterized protein LOC143287362 [Babylonia areolata]|uniref:uncharacterized protein LOC143287362 n=1 Tax=Babylonia areolata TaxID=304850 RepID=UPI003FD20748
MKYVRSSEDISHRNVMAVQVDEQVFYKAVRDIQPGEEMLLYARDALYPEMELETMAMHKLSDENQTYPCGECGEILKSKVARRRHQTYACPKTHSYLSRMTLQHHDKTADKPMDSDGKSLDSENSGLEQESGLEGEYKCDQCPKSFQWKSNLVRHQVTHDEDRRYPCENCDKVFTDPSNLQRHIRSQHVGARCHACGECGKTFATSSGLKQHQHIHSSIKPFQCEVCLKAYTQFSNLCRHKRMHADCRQQIKCKDCGQAFSTVTSLSKHKRFCEGALRSGMRLCYPQDKLPPLTLSPGAQPPPGFNPAYLYGPRPFHPFFPPLGGTTFPVLQPGLPQSMLGPAALSPHSALSLAANGLMGDSLMGGEKRPHSGSASEDEDKISSKPRDDFSDGASAEQDPGSFSEEDREHSPKKMKREPGEISPTFRSSKALSSSAQASPPSRFLLKAHSSPSAKHESSTSLALDVPFDLSVGTSGSGRENKSPSISQAERRTPPSPKDSPSSSSGDAPLDLSVSKKETTTTSTPKVEVTSPAEDPIKSTHVFGAKTPVIPEPKYPFSTSLPYPLPAAPPSFVESMLRMKEEKPLSLSYQQDLAKFVFPRFPMPPLHGSFPGLGHLSMLRPELDKALAAAAAAASSSSSPMLKLDKPGGGRGADPHAPHPHPHPHHTPFPFGSPAVSTAGAAGSGHHHSNKLKERYACKFCGKIFPRSANLTRHLRTHTGEQPYKCKYCERSFSISSNLQRHVRNIHNKEKPFRCPLCDRSFGQQTNLDRHLKKHEQEGPNVSDSPTAELEQKDDAYYSEIRSFLAKSLDPLNDPAVQAPPSQDLATPLNDLAAPLKDLSDPEDEKTSDLTIVDDVEDEDELPLSDDAGDADIDSAGEDLTLVDGRAEKAQDVSAASPPLPLAPVLNNNSEVKDADGVNGVVVEKEGAGAGGGEEVEGEEVEEGVSGGSSKEGYEVKVSRGAPIACST